MFADTWGGSAPAPDAGRDGSREKDRNIYVHIDGSGPIEVTGNGANKETILEVLTDHIKPVLLNIIQGEIYEEGDFSYEY